MFAAADLIPISALQHYLYCPRQCALIHLEQIWTESVHTAEGRILHEKVHSGTAQTRGNVKTVTGLSLRSSALGLVGQADMVEFHRRDAVWHPYPVEYKRGRPKSIDADRVQLCAQALCLEEMLGLPVPEGALFYGKIRRRTTVFFDTALREATITVTAAVRAMLDTGRTPLPPTTANTICAACSLCEDCMPLIFTQRPSANRYLETLLEIV